MKKFSAKIFIVVLTLLCFFGIYWAVAGNGNKKTPIERKNFMERSLVILKPDCMQKNLSAKVTERIQNANLRIRNRKTMQLDEKILKEHYKHIAHLPFFPEIVDFMSSSQVIVMVVEGDNAVAKIRSLLGPTDPKEAAPGTIRGDFGTDKMRNVAHASDSNESAEIEIKRFFGEI